VFKTKQELAQGEFFAVCDSAERIFDPRGFVKDKFGPVFLTERRAPDT
jgi:hypothetical protein